MSKRPYISKSKRYEILKEQNWRCAKCGAKLKYSRDHEIGEKLAHIDHIFPISREKNYHGNINDRKNLRGLCEACNIRKSNKIEGRPHCPVCGRPLWKEAMMWSEGWKDYFSQEHWGKIKNDVWPVYVCNSCGVFHPMEVFKHS